VAVRSAVVEALAFANVTGGRESFPPQLAPTAVVDGRRARSSVSQAGGSAATAACRQRRADRRHPKSAASGRRAATQWSVTVSITRSVPLRPAPSARRP
jgi:hypothetical protein